ncbi:HARB1 nuclease, partial [Acromyrmex charruanus]
LQVLIALNFISSSSYQKRVDQDFLTYVSQPTISKILRNVIVNALNILMNDWIQFPIENADIQHVKETFWIHTQFPGVSGAIDGTHIAIVPPNIEREHLYINRKLYHLLNVLIFSHSSIEQTIGRLKGSWRCLRKDRTLYSIYFNETKQI